MYMISSHRGQRPSHHHHTASFPNQPCTEESLEEIQTQIELVNHADRIYKMVCNYWEILFTRQFKLV